MNFLLGLLSCGHSKQPTKPSSNLPKLCLLGNEKHQLYEENIPTSSTLNMNKSQSASSKPLTQISINSQPIVPETNFLLYHLRSNQKMRSIDWGYLVGILNANRTEVNLMRGISYCIQIGQHQEINSLKSLRPYSLDHLVIFWKEHNLFTIEEIVSSSQRLMIVFQEWGQIKPVLRLLQQEILLKLGEFCLRQNQSRISFNIIAAENKIILQFLDPIIFHQHLQLMLKNTMGIELEGQHFQLLLQKMTLKDYADFKKQVPEAKLKINHYLREIESEIKLNQIHEILKIKDRTFQLFQLKSNGSERKEKSEIVHKNSSDQIEILAQFFAKKAQLRDGASAKNSNDDNLMIFEFNRSNENEESAEAHIHEFPKKAKTARKGRSRSSDATFIPEQFLDDELFDKY